jgi:hypothetical protein
MMISMTMQWQWKLQGQIIIPQIVGMMEVSWRLTLAVKSFEKISKAFE